MHRYQVLALCSYGEGALLYKSVRLLSSFSNKDFIVLRLYKILYYRIYNKDQRFEYFFFRDS